MEATSSTPPLELDENTSHDNSIEDDDALSDISDGYLSADEVEEDNEPVLDDELLDGYSSFLTLEMNTKSKQWTRCQPWMTSPKSFHEMVWNLAPSRSTSRTC